MMHDLLLAALKWDDTMQVMGLLASLVGVLLSARAVWETHVLHRLLPRTEHQLILRSHLISHGVMLYVQLTFGTISVLVYTLPEMPIEMLLEPDHYWITVVVVLRKFLRFSAILVLMLATIYKRRERRRLLGY